MKVITLNSVIKKKLVPVTSFFDDLTPFHDTGTSPVRRLNMRYAAVIEHNKEILQDKTVLDIASHDGRWTYAALKTGAKRVVGLEARPEFVAKSYKNLREYGVSEEQFEFIEGDAHETISRLDDQFDVVLLLGFFYHTNQHFRLLEEIQKHNPEHIIIESNIAKYKEPIIKLCLEPSEDPLRAVSENPVSLVGWPSLSALEGMLSYFGYSSFEYFDWMTSFEKPPPDYKDGRVTLTAKREKQDWEKVSSIVPPIESK